MQTVTFKGTTRELKSLLHSLPALISGKKPDTQGIGRMFKHAVAYYLFEQIEHAFVEKSWGGTDNLGYKWKPLKKSTIAYRPIGPGDVRKYRLPRNRTRGLLTPVQNRTWKQTFYRMYKKLSQRLTDTNAKILAAKIAWAKVKAGGARTKLEVLGNRKVQILVVTKRLFESVQAGSYSSGTYTPPSEQLFQSGRGEIRIGSKVPYFAKQNKARTIIPPPSRIGPWLKAAVRAAVTDITPQITRLVSR